MLKSTNGCFEWKKMQLFFCYSVSSSTQRFTEGCVENLNGRTCNCFLCYCVTVSSSIQRFTKGCVSVCS